MVSFIAGLSLEMTYLRAISKYGIASQAIDVNKNTFNLCESSKGL